MHIPSVEFWYVPIKTRLPFDMFLFFLYSVQVTLKPLYYIKNFR